MTENADRPVSFCTVCGGPRYTGDTHAHGNSYSGYGHNATR